MTRFPRFCAQSPQSLERSPDAVPLLVTPTSNQQEAKSSLGFKVGDRVCWIEATGAIYEVIKISGGHATIECIEYRGKSAPPLKRRVPLWQIKTLDVGSDVGQQNAKSSRGLQLGSSEQLELPLNATDRNHEDLCLSTSTSLAGLEVSQEQRNSLGEYKQPDLLRVTPTHSLSCDRTGPTFPSTTTSAPIPLELENLISSLGDGPATIPAVQAIAPDSTAKSQDFGEKCSESSASQDPGLSLWNSLKDLSLEDFEQCLEHYEWQAINSTIRSSYRLRKQEQCIN